MFGTRKQRFGIYRDSTVSADELKDWVRQLEQLEAESFVASYPSSLAPFGLEDPICRLIFYERDAKWQSVELMVGNRSDDRGYYAMVKGRDIIFQLSAEWVQLCMKNLRKSERISDGE